MELYPNSQNNFQKQIIQYVQLNSETYAAKTSVHPLEITTESSMDYLTNCLIIQLYTQVYGRNMKAITFSFPVDWIQAFKARWFPAWLLKKYPVKNKDYVIEPKEFYPMMSFPDKKGCVSLMVTNTDTWKYTDIK